MASAPSQTRSPSYGFNNSGNNPDFPGSGGLVGCVAALAHAPEKPTSGLDPRVARNADAALAALKEKFRRPAAIPFPVSNPYSAEKPALGERLFHDKRLSANGTIACATCHDRTKGFSDGRATAVGVPGRALARHTPTLWNLAWTGPVFWDGRARSLEEQVAGPITAPDEMAQPMAPLIRRLAADPDYARAFAKAFPDDPRVSEANLKKAIATARGR